MNCHFKLASSAMLVLGFAQASATETLGTTFGCTAGDGSESLYEIWLYDAGTPDTVAAKGWDAAKLVAESRNKNGEPGHLATFRDAVEESCVLAAADGLGLAIDQQLWIGLVQDAAGNEPAGGWGWVTGEPLFDYVNWANGEPNNTGGNEEHGTIGRFGYVGDETTIDAVGWNDEIATRGTLFGFVVEFDNTVQAQNCLEDADEIPPGQVGIGGCNPSGYMINELSNLLDGQLQGKSLTQGAAPALPAAQTDACGLENGVPTFDLVAQDPRVDEFGNLIGPSFALDLSTVFDLSGFFPPGTQLADKVYLRADTVGSPCLALIVSDANFDFSDLTDFLPNGGVYTVTQFPELVPGMYTLPEVGGLDVQDDLQFVPQAAYQSHDRFLLVEEAASPFTSDVINPQRQKTPTFSFFPLNTREVCLFLDPTLDPGDGRPYFEAVLQCKVDLAVEYFGNLETAIIEAAPNLVRPSLNRLLRDVNRARSMVKVGRWDKGTADLMSLLNQVEGGTWIVDARNDPGILIMRIENLLWRIEQLEQAENNL